MTSSAGPAGFWSYVHADDDGEAGRTRRLAERIRSGFSLITGGDIEIFVDRCDLSWGDQWRGRIDDALAGTTFFIPVITPRYFASRECRRELLAFAGQAESLGVGELLLPILWVNVTGLATDSDDEVLAMVARTQYEPWVDLRLEDEDSPAYRRAVNRLAQRLAGIAETIANRPVELLALGSDAEGITAEDDGEGDAPGFWDLIAQGEEVMPRWTTVMDEFSAVMQQVGELTNSASERMNQASAERKSAAARIIVARNFAQELDEPAQRMLELGTSYASELVNLDPVILTTIRTADDDMDDAGRRTLCAFFGIIGGLVRESHETASSATGFRETMRDTAKMSRDLRKPLIRMMDGIRRAEDAQAIIDEWGRRVEQANLDCSDFRNVHVDVKQRRAPRPPGR